jgi:hypothetical protein
MLHGVGMLDGIVNPPDKHSRLTHCRIAVVHPLRAEAMTAETALVLTVTATDVQLRLMEPLDVTETMWYTAPAGDMARRAGLVGADRRPARWLG